MDFISPGPRSLKVVDIPNIDTRCQSSNKQQHANVHGCLKFHNIIVLSCLPSFNLNVRKGKKEWKPIKNLMLVIQKKMPECKFKL